MHVSVLLKTTFRSSCNWQVVSGSVAAEAFKQHSMLILANHFKAAVRATELNMI